MQGLYFTRTSEWIEVMKIQTHRSLPNKATAPSGQRPSRASPPRLTTLREWAGTDRYLPSRIGVSGGDQSARVLPGTTSASEGDEPASSLGGGS